MPGTRTLTITCGSCLQPWEEQHRCPVPPEIDFARYTDEALERLATHLALVLKGRKGTRQEV